MRGGTASPGTCIPPTCRRTSERVGDVGLLGDRSVHEGSPVYKSEGAFRLSALPRELGLSPLLPTCAPLSYMWGGWGRIPDMEG